MASPKGGAKKTKRRKGEISFSPFDVRQLLDYSKGFFTTSMFRGGGIDSGRSSWESLSTMESSR